MAILLCTPSLALSYYEYPEDAFIYAAKDEAASLYDSLQVPVHATRFGGSSKMFATQDDVFGIFCVKDTVVHEETRCTVWIDEQSESLYNYPHREAGKLKLFLDDFDANYFYRSLDLEETIDGPRTFKSFSTADEELEIECSYCHECSPGRLDLSCRVSLGLGE